MSKKQIFIDVTESVSQRTRYLIEVDQAELDGLDEGYPLEEWALDVVISDERTSQMRVVDTYDFQHHDVLLVEQAGIGENEREAVALWPPTCDGCQQRHHHYKEIHGRTYCLVCQLRIKTDHCPVCVIKIDSGQCDSCGWVLKSTADEEGVS